jgi:hypothetical protein
VYDRPRGEISKPLLYEAAVLFYARGADAGGRCLAPLDVLKICALKTAPAFEAALFAGLRRRAREAADDVQPRKLSQLLH